MGSCDGEGGRTEWSLEGNDSCDGGAMPRGQILLTRRFPAQTAVKNVFIRGSVVRYVHLPANAVDTPLLEDATRRGKLDVLPPHTPLMSLDMGGVVLVHLLYNGGTS